MNGLALCAGVGGLELGLKLAIPSHRTVCYVEREAYCAATLVARMEDETLDRAPIWDDLTTFDGSGWCGIVDIVSAGFPCQPFSVAGKRLGMADKRNLWPQVIRIIREVQPQLVFLENSPQLKKYLDVILVDLAESGYDARWDCIPAAAVGANHRRDRLWIVAHASQSGLEGLRHRAIGSGEEEPGSASSSWWEAEPDVGRVADGVASQMDRLRAIGNGVVPLAAAYAFLALTTDPGNKG